MKLLVNKMDKFFYPDFSDNWDDKLFREYILKEITTDTILLDIGAGAGILSEMNFRGLAKKVYGIDPDPRVLENKNLDEGTLGTGDSIPFDNGFFDVIICDNVLEHVTNPQRFFRESYRVLKSKGIFLTKTPNRYHYVPIIAMFTPTWLHKFINSLRGRQEEDTFPTVYKVNTKKTQKRTAIEAGFTQIDIACIEGRPEYLRITPITYLLGMLYERMVNLLRLNVIKVILIGKFTK